MNSYFNTTTKRYYDLQACLDIFDFYHELLRDFKNVLTSDYRREVIGNELATLRQLHSTEFSIAEAHIKQSY